MPKIRSTPLPISASTIACPVVIRRGGMFVPSRLVIARSPPDCSQVDPLRPSGRRGWGPSRSDGRVRWVAPRALESPTSPRPSPPPGAERERCWFPAVHASIPLHRQAAVILGQGECAGVGADDVVYLGLLAAAVEGVVLLE